MKKTNLKKIISLVLILVMTFSFVACTVTGDRSEASSSLSSSVSTSDSSKEESVDSSINSELSESTSSIESSDEEPVSEVSEESSEAGSSGEPSSEASIESAEEPSEASSEEESSEEPSSEESSKDVVYSNPYAGTDIKPAEGKVIAFTFDDGPRVTENNVQYTEKILNKLEELNIKATFFIVGNRVNQNTAPLIKRMVELGCDIGNHSYNHPDVPGFTGMTISQVQKQIDDTNARLEKFVGVKATLIRPPYGNITKDQVVKLNVPIINWDIDTEDWKLRNVQAVYDRTMKLVHSGGIVLMHDIHATSADAFCLLADELVAQGYTFVTVSELLGTQELLKPTIKYNGR